MSTYIPIPPYPPGYDFYWDRARDDSVAAGGITIVMPDGKYAHVPFQLNWDNLKGRPAGDYFEHFFMSAGKQIAKHVASLSAEEINDE